MTVKVYFDLDGTIFDLYGKEKWLEMIETEQSGVFEGDFLPEINEDHFYTTVGDLLDLGVQFGVITWLPMGASPEYEEICRAEKMAWVKEFMPFISEFNCVSY